jgi:hypothetical protein
MKALASQTIENLAEKPLLFFHWRVLEMEALPTENLVQRSIIASCPWRVLQRRH